MNIFISVLLGIVTSVTGWLGYQTINQPDAVGTDPFTLQSVQLAPSPVADYILSTDGTDNVWIVNSGGGGGSTLHVDGGGFVYPQTGDYHSSPYYVATSSTASSTFVGLTATNVNVSGYLLGTLTGNADTATALAANGGNCTAGNAPLGVDASGAVESCFDVWTEAENTAAAYLSTVDISDNTNLTADGTNVVLTDDALSLGTALSLTYASSTGLTSTNLWGTNLSVTSATATTMNATTYYGDASNMTLATLGDSTYSTVQHLQNIFHSSGYVSGGAITEATPSTIDVAAGTGLIRDADSGVATIYYFDWAASSSIPIASDTITYIGVDYNGGTPIVITKTTRDWNFKTQFELGQVVTDGTDMHIASIPDAVGDHAMNMVQRMYGEMKIARDEEEGGLILSETGTRNLSLSGGSLWTKLTKVTVAATSSFQWDAYYGSDGAGWNEYATTTWDNARYDNAGTLTAMTANRWGVHWFYIETDDSVVMVYTPTQYTSQAAAEAAAQPSTVPDRIDMHGRLFAKLVFQEGASSGTIYTLWGGINTTGSAASDHGSLSGLLDDDHTQYLLANGTRALSGSLDVGGNVLYGVSGLVVTGSSTLGYASSTAISGTNLSFTSATATTLAVSTTFNFLGDIITNVGTWFLTKLNAVTGAIDWGGITSLEIPNGASPTVDATGETAVDTTSDQYIYYGASAKRVLTPFDEKSVYLASTTRDASYNTFISGTTTHELANYSRAVTLDSFYCKTDTGTTSARFGDGTNWTALVVCTTSGATGSSLSNNTFTAREDVQLQVGTAAGNPNKVTVTATFLTTAD